jgi:hypothetical protein
VVHNEAALLAYSPKSMAEALEVLGADGRKRQKSLTEVIWTVLDDGRAAVVRLAIASNAKVTENFILNRKVWKEQTGVVITFSLYLLYHELPAGHYNFVFTFVLRNEKAVSDLTFLLLLLFASCMTSSFLLLY